MVATDFLNDLRNRYGDISLKNFLSRIKEFCTDKSATPKPIETTPKIRDESLDAVAGYGINNQQTNTQSPTITRRYPIATPAPKHKFLPVNIGELKDWWELRQIVLDLHEFKNFFAGKQDSQSPALLELIGTYAREVEKKLTEPAELDESASLNFVKNLAEVIEKRFYTMLQTCKPGLEGKCKQPRSYYQSLDTLIKRYFKNIGLETCTVRVRESFRNWREHMQTTAVMETPFEHLDNAIAGVDIAPHYFQFINDEGEEDKFWLDGKCSVYKYKKKVMM